MENSFNQDRPRRREYSKQFKAEVLAHCAQLNASVGGVALAHGLHLNMVHRWIREQHSKPILDALHQWMTLQRQKQPDSSATGRGLDNRGKIRKGPPGIAVRLR